MQNIIDIIIPTKNRYSTLIPAVKAIIGGIGDWDYNIIIYDNSDAVDDSEDMQQLKEHQKVEYFHDDDKIDAVENFNRALDKAASEYVILIGDDDLVIPSLRDAVFLMRSNGLECLIQQRPTYYWQSIKFDRELDFFSPSSLQITRNVSGTVELLSSKIELKKVLELGGLYLYDLPALYHGIVKTEVLRNIKKKYGAYVLGPSPDISLAYVLAVSIETYGKYFTPFSIAGASYNSAAGMGRRGEHSATLENAPAWLPREILNNWDPLLPRLWNGYTVYAQSLYICGKKSGSSVSVNYDALYRKIISENIFDLKFILKEESIRHSIGWLTILIGTINFQIRWLALKMPNFVVNFIVHRRPAFKDLEFYRDLYNPEACISCADEHIEKYKAK